MSEEAVESGPKRQFSPGLIVLLLVLSVGVLGFAFYRTSTAEDAARIDNSRSLKILGLGTPTTNRLDPAFADENQDLVADAPAAEAQRAPEVLRFCYLSEEADTDASNWQPLLDELSQRTGKAVEYAAFPNTEAQLAAVRAGELDITAFNTGNVPRAVNAAGFVPVVAPATSGELASYRTLLIATPASGIKKVSDLKGRLVAMTRVGSNSGFKAPMVILYRDFDLQPERDFDLAFTGSHTNSIEAIKKGTYEVAATASDLLDAAVAEGKIKASDFVVVYESATFPQAVLGHAHDLSPDLATAVADTLLSFSPAGTTVADEYAGQDTDGFAPLDYKESFALVRLIDDAVGFDHTLEAQTPAETSPVNTPAE